jgi:hypothetical protein
MLQCGALGCAKHRQACDGMPGPEAKGMKTSKTIAGLIGPTIVAIAAGMLLNIGSFPELAEQVSRDPALIFVSGILLFVAGLAIVRAHNRWTKEWPVLVTILGWLAILSGLARMLFPTEPAAIAAGFGQNIGAIIAGAIVLLGLGAFLSFMTYRRD